MSDYDEVEDFGASTGGADINVAINRLTGKNPYKCDYVYGGSQGRKVFNSVCEAPAQHIVYEGRAFPEEPTLMPDVHTSHTSSYLVCPHHLQEALDDITRESRMKQAVREGSEDRDLVDFSNFDEKGFISSHPNFSISGHSLHISEAPKSHMYSWFKRVLRRNTDTYYTRRRGGFFKEIEDIPTTPEFDETPMQFFRRRESIKAEHAAIRSKVRGVLFRQRKAGGEQYSYLDPGRPASELDDEGQQVVRTRDLRNALDITGPGSSLPLPLHPEINLPYTSHVFAPLQDPQTAHPITRFAAQKALEEHSVYEDLEEKSGKGKQEKGAILGGSGSTDSDDIEQGVAADVDNISDEGLTNKARKKLTKAAKAAEDNRLDRRGNRAFPISVKAHPETGAPIAWHNDQAVMVNMMPTKGSNGEPGTKAIGPQLASVYENRSQIGAEPKNPSISSGNAYYQQMDDGGIQIAQAMRSHTWVPSSTPATWANGQPMTMDDVTNANTYSHRQEGALTLVPGSPRFLRAEQTVNQKLEELRTQPPRVATNVRCDLCNNRHSGGSEKEAYQSLYNHLKQDHHFTTESASAELAKKSGRSVTITPKLEVSNGNMTQEDLQQNKLGLINE